MSEVKDLGLQEGQAGEPLTSEHLEPGSRAAGAGSETIAGGEGPIIVGNPTPPERHYPSGITGNTGQHAEGGESTIQPSPRGKPRFRADAVAPLKRGFMLVGPAGA
ncbi:MAG TPA: hypothetical protein VNT60_11365, partial [Deinococcales bacterium]|nr:hypothetical protein [Deinococcales bacterium]